VELILGLARCLAAPPPLATRPMTTALSRMLCPPTSLDATLVMARLAAWDAVGDARRAAGPCAHRPDLADDMRMLMHRLLTGTPTYMIDSAHLGKPRLT
jgi:hypothetical protein